jgi:hypothetical protein
VSTGVHRRDHLSHASNRLAEAYQRGLARRNVEVLERLAGVIELAVEGCLHRARRTDLPKIRSKSPPKPGLFLCARGPMEPRSRRSRGTKPRDLSRIQASGRTPPNPTGRRKTSKVGGPSAPGAVWVSRVLGGQGSAAAGPARATAGEARGRRPSMVNPRLPNLAKVLLIADPTLQSPTGLRRVGSSGSNAHGCRVSDWEFQRHCVT